ncbi:acyl-[acyl-carrier-protein] thioesterase [Anaerococcus hydrogenalis]|uniref:Acyl-ACP thioesterase n=1 Tax=Anaerococcus hydrogenalis ACS-025-V-Sch4 TaxID=879306 RepID=F0H211_9FIRM|nr:acyl-ACP thioesterase domain-containing protein [Anaerococcus hydrogenalis]EGC83552.1 Acyl-ACP thioesterase [Anaerococcus hydrogenalis ACS-025-V-Sch4]
MRKTKEFEIGRFITNSEGYLKNKYLLSLMFEVSFDQAEEVEDEKIMKDKRWIVYSWDIKIEKPIKAKDKIKITTFAIDMNKFYAYRNFFIEKDGEIIAKAYCVFLLFDIKKMRPVKIPKEIASAYQKEDPIYEEKSHKYDKNFGSLEKIQIRRTDLDSNYHVNNASYMDLLGEISEVKDQDVEFINIVYKNEIRDKKYVFGQKCEKNNEISYELVDENGKIYSFGKIRRRNVQG